ncbi:MAG: peptide chain release factor 1 [Thermoplasmata archaeon]|nr:MAG: peptide chain release factor 1 [Thermoplasmata archaeon]
MDVVSAKAKYDFKRRLEDIQMNDGRATELISLYIPPTRQISDVVAYLRNEYSQSSNIKSKSTRKNVMAAIESLMNRLKSYKKPPPNGLAMFVGHVAKGADQTKMYQQVIEPPFKVNTFMYRCDSSFHLEPLESMLVEEECYGLIVIDRAEATLGMLRGKRIEPIKNVQSRVPSKHGRGGQSQRRFERLIEIAAHDFFKKIGDLVTESFLDEKHLKGILVGGPGATKIFFIEKDYIHHELKKKIIDTFDTGYTDEYGLKELVEKASSALTKLDLMREKRLIQRLMNEIKKDRGGLSVYGEDLVRKAMALGAVDTVLVSEGLRMVRRTFHCPKCGEKEEKTMRSMPESDGPEVSCLKCNAAMELRDEKDLVDEFAELADETGTKIELISNDSSEGEMLLKAFGGLAGLLRFKVNN